MLQQQQQQQENTNITPGEDGDVLNMEEHKLGASKDYSRQELMREQVVDVMDAQEDQVMGRKKYDPVVEVDMAGTGKDILQGRMVGQDIAARIRLLFDDDNGEVVEQVKSTEQGGLVKGMVEELDRTVVIKRRARNGQKREEGVRMQRLDDLFRSRNDPQTRKRKLNTWEPSEEKERKFGQ